MARKPGNERTKVASKVATAQAKNDPRKPLNLKPASANAKVASKPAGKDDTAGATLGAVHEGALTAAGRRFALVVSRFNDFIVDKLVDGALDALRRTGAAEGAVEIFRCPGAMELPGLARRVVEDLEELDSILAARATQHFETAPFAAVEDHVGAPADAKLSRCTVWSASIA